MSNAESAKPLEKCGIVMPISSTDGCDESHWQDVLGILKDAISDAGLAANLVSASNDVGIIQKRIVQNLYDNPIVVVDISGRNANVMFELGMRLAFDKPTIVIKDDQTPYSFDTSPLEHLTYPRDLRFGTISKFKKELAGKIMASINRNGETSFLKSFGDFKVAEIDVAQAPIDSIILEEIQDMKRQLQSFRKMIDVSSGNGIGKGVSRNRSIASRILNPVVASLRIPIHSSTVANSSELAEIINELRSTTGVLEAGLDREGGETFVDISIDPSEISNRQMFFETLSAKISDIIPF
jgi:hypothetical protein